MTVKDRRAAECCKSDPMGQAAFKDLGTPIRGCSGVVISAADDFKIASRLGASVHPRASSGWVSPLPRRAIGERRRIKLWTGENFFSADCASRSKPRVARRK